MVVRPPGHGLLARRCTKTYKGHVDVNNNPFCQHLSGMFVVVGVSVV
jgi:hypothetical protein